MKAEWRPNAQDAPGDPRAEVTYARFPEIGLGFVPIICEGDAAPSEEHFAEAAKRERALRAHEQHVDPNRGGR